MYNFCFFFLFFLPSNLKYNYKYNHHVVLEINFVRTGYYYTLYLGLLFAVVRGKKGFSRLRPFSVGVSSFPLISGPASVLGAPTKGEDGAGDGAETKGSS